MKNQLFIILFLSFYFGNPLKAQLQFKNPSFEAYDYIPDLSTFQYYIPHWTYCENVPYVKGKFFKWYCDTSIYTPPVYGSATEGYFFIAMIARSYWLENDTILFPDAIRETISISLKCSSVKAGHQYKMSLDVRRVQDFAYGAPYFYIHFSKDTCDTTNVVYNSYVSDTGWHKKQFTFEAKDTWNHLSIRCRHMYLDSTTFKGREPVQMYLDNLSPVYPDTAYNSEHFPIVSTCKGLGVYTLRSPYTGQEQYWYEGNKQIGKGDSMEISPQNATTYTLVLGKDSCIPSVLQSTITPNCGAAQLFFPNAFSPNGDAKNEGFRAIQNANLWQLKDYELTVYNRWGERIWQSKYAGQAWDGGNASMGIYFWLCRYTLADGTKSQQKGDVSLIK